MSDSDTSDSDSGIRFKTTSTRYKSERIDKNTSSSKSNRSTSSSNRRSRDRDRDRDRRRSSVDRKYSNRTRSKSRSRSRERRKRRERDRRRHRSKSRSRSRSKQSSRGKQEKDKSSVENRNSQTDLKPSSSTVVEPSTIESGKILDISVSSLSSQEEAVEKDEVPVDYFGPVLPPVLHQGAGVDSILDTEEINDAIGPALPPHLSKGNQEENNARVIGPALPANIKLSTDVNESSESELSPFSEEEPSAADEDDDFIGPMPGASSSRSQLELEQRALELKLRQLDADRYDSKATAVKSREDWMVELPDIRKISDMGLGARQFRTREKQEIGDRSVWTDTPSDRERKKTAGPSTKDLTRDRELEEERRTIAERDKQQEEMIKRHKKKHKRDKSLLELHQKKAKKEKEKSESDGPTRRPFDRNVDLQANRFDEAQKKAIFKKAQLLDTRFSSGASKYL